MSGEGASIFNAGEAMKPQTANKLSTVAFCAFKYQFEPIQRAIAIWSSSGLSRFPMPAIGKLLGTGAGALYGMRELWIPLLKATT